MFAEFHLQIWSDDVPFANLNFGSSVKVFVQSVETSELSQVLPILTMMKSLLLVSIWSFITVDGALAPGDCAFVGVYGNEDDFALVLLEDAQGESIFVTEGSPDDSHFTVGHWACCQGSCCRF